MTKKSVLPAGYALLSDQEGKGGMARVFKVRHLRSGKVRALKCLREELSQEPSAVAGFYREFEFLKRFNSRNIMRVYPEESSYAQRHTCHTHYFCMEWIDGMGLREWVEPRLPLDEGGAAKIMLQLLRALDHIHTSGLSAVIHRDLRPDNVLIEEKSGRLVLFDFGISFCKGDKLDTKTWGTPTFMSPEHMKPESLCEQSDIYSAGVIYYFLITGGVPFKANKENPLRVAVQHQFQQPPPPWEISPRHLAGNGGNHPTGIEKGSEPSLPERSGFHRCHPAAIHRSGNRGGGTA